MAPGRRFENETSDKVAGPPTGLERNILSSVRVIAIILGALALALAKAIPDIVNLIVAGASAIMVFLPSVLMALFKGTRKVVPSVASIICGVLVLIPFLLQSPKIAFIPATLGACPSIRHFLL